MSSSLKRNRLNYRNMNGTMLSQIVWVGFLAITVYQKISNKAASITISFNVEVLILDLHSLLKIQYLPSVKCKSCYKVLKYDFKPHNNWAGVTDLQKDRAEVIFSEAGFFFR